MTCTWTFIQHSRTGRIDREVGLQLKQKVERSTSALASDLPALHSRQIGLRIATGRLDFNLRSLTFWRVRQLRPRAASIFLPRRVELPIGAVGVDGGIERAYCDRWSSRHPAVDNFVLASNIQRN